MFSSRTGHRAPSHRASISMLCLGALGVVFGDIGTSPLYTLKECIQHAGHGVQRESLLGLLSLIFWSLVIVAPLLLRSGAEIVYAWLQRNAVTADLHFGIPPRQVIEIGTQIDL